MFFVCVSEILAINVEYFFPIETHFTASCLSSCSDTFPQARGDLSLASIVLATGSYNYLVAIASTGKPVFMTQRALKSVLGSQLRSLRKARKLTQEAIAEHLGFTPRYYAGIERGERNLSLDSIDDLALRLEVPALSLLREDEHGAPNAHASK